VIVKHYVVGELQVTDPGWIARYVQAVTPMIERCGGRYLARTGRIEKLEGDRPLPQVQLLIEFPSREAALAFYESDEYRPHRDARTAGCRSEFSLVAGEDVAGAARIAE
jgi:uncharacterized protein (DUF1330 family)